MGREWHLSYFDPQSFTTNGLPGGASGKESTCQCRRHRDMGSIPGLGRSPGGGDGNSLQYSFLENPMDRGVCWAVVHRIAKSQTWLKWFSTHRTNEAYSLHRFTDYFHFQFMSFAYFYTVLLYLSFIINL